jgi:tRNA modification GTPase
MFNPDDTIVAIATPPGRGGIGVVRVSGPEAGAIAAAITGRTQPLEARRATLERVRAGGPAIDRAVLTFFPSPHSYTGEDVLEISAHGSPVLLRAIVASAIASGARLAQAGEFTFRAYLRGRIDLVQAEAVQDLVSAVTPLQARAAFDQLEGTLTTRIREIDAALFDLCARLEASLDFPDEGYHFVEPGAVARECEMVRAQVRALLATARRGRLLREGCRVALAGAPNVGKSLLFNALLGSSRAIVTPVAGTTRDLLTERCDIGGLAVTLIDTAGVRDSDEPIEQEGIARARQAADAADVRVLVLDRSRPYPPAAPEGSGATVIVANKCDLPSAWSVNQARGAIAVSALTGEGLDAVRRAIVHAAVAMEPLADTPAIANARHTALLERVEARLGEAAAQAASGAGEELVLATLQDAFAALDEIVGKRSSEDVLRQIFARFCIGK